MFIERQPALLLFVFQRPSCEAAGPLKNEIDLWLCRSINMPPLRGFKQVNRRATDGGKMSEAHSNRRAELHGARCAPETFYIWHSFPRRESSGSKQSQIERGRLLVEQRGGDFANHG